jgi:hypothetical protein
VKGPISIVAWIDGNGVFEQLARMRGVACMSLKLGQVRQAPMLRLAVQLHSSRIGPSRLVKTLSALL